MKLKVDAPESRKRLTVQLKASVMEDLRAYQSFVSEETGSSADLGLVVDSMLAQFMNSDRDFRAFKNQRTDDDENQTKPSEGLGDDDESAGESDTSVSDDNTTSMFG